MSDEKDPVRDQIQRDAAYKMAWTGENGRPPDAIDGYITGANDYWNRCLDEVITMISIRQDGAYGDSEYSELERLKQELEKKRR